MALSNAIHTSATPRFRFNKHQHDFGRKAIFNQDGEFGGDDAVRIILAQAAAPRFLARQLVSYFVCDPSVSDELVEPLARELRGNGFHVEPVVRQILTSRYFFSQASIGQKIRSPVELAIGLLRSLEGTIGTISLAEALRPLGQRVFFPPNVKGWEGGRQWINATTFIGRVNLVAKLLRDGNVRFRGGTLAHYVDRQHLQPNAATAEQLVDALAELLLAVPLPNSARRELIDVARLHGRKVAQSADDVLRTLAVLPEFQLG